MGSEVVQVRDAERGRALSCLVTAFSSDPVLRWLYPEPAEYLRHYPEFVEAFGGVAFVNESVWRLGNFTAIAMWMAPGVELDGDAIVAKFESSVDASKLDDVMAVIEQMDAAHPTEPHWYLPWFGVDCTNQGEGLGSALMAPCLEIVDRDHVPAYLDSTNPRNLSFYERHGFQVTGEAKAGACPPLISMYRDAR
jgi:ribosomal protein S18 acetylase RimI-like enzyme